MTNNFSPEVIMPALMGSMAPPWMPKFFRSDIIGAKDLKWLDDYSGKLAKETGTEPVSFKGFGPDLRYLGCLVPPGRYLSFVPMLMYLCEIQHDIKITRSVFSLVKETQQEQVRDMVARGYTFQTTHDPKKFEYIESVWARGGSLGNQEHDERLFLIPDPQFYYDDLPWYLLEMHGASRGIENFPAVIGDQLDNIIFRMVFGYAPERLIPALAVWDHEVGTATMAWLESNGFSWNRETARSFVIKTFSEKFTEAQPGALLLYLKEHLLGIMEDSTYAGLSMNQKIDTAKSAIDAAIRFLGAALDLHPMFVGGLVSERHQ